MKNNSLLKRVSALGFPLFGVEEDQNANLTLADMVKSRDLRLWEGLPVVLANSAEKGLFNFDKVNYYLKKPFDKSYFASLMAMSLALYEFFNLKFSWADEFYKSLSSDRKKEFSGFLEKFKNDDDLNVAGREMSAHRLKSVFNNYFSQSKAKLNEFLSAKDELNLEYSLSQVFSPKQKELFYKKLKREKLTKTEKEYFSRVVKKKVSALANTELYHLAQRLLDQLIGHRLESTDKDRAKVSSEKERRFHYSEGALKAIDNIVRQEKRKAKRIKPGKKFSSYIKKLTE